MILDVSEYIDSSHGNPIEPPVAHQTLVLGAEPAQSKPFHKSTKVVRIVCDVDCRLSFGPDPQEPTSFVPAGCEMVRVVYPESGFRLCAVLAGADAQAGADALNNAAAFFELLASPAKHRAVLDKLSKARDDAQAACAQLGDLKAKSKTLAAERTAFEKWTAAERESLRDAKDQLAAERAQLEAEKRSTSVTLRRWHVHVQPSWPNENATKPRLPGSPSCVPS